VGVPARHICALVCVVRVVSHSSLLILGSGPFHLMRPFCLCTVGCKKYQDFDWLSRIRRWPPSMVDHLRNFLTLRSVKQLKPQSGTQPAFSE
jgi:hypothetical protein